MKNLKHIPAFLLLLVGLNSATAQSVTQNQKLVAPSRLQYDNYGVDLDVDGTYMIVGAQGEDEDAAGLNTMTSAGAAYIYESNALATMLVAPTRRANDKFGFSVAISGDYAVVGAPESDYDASEANYLSKAGSAYVYRRTAGVWTLEAKLVAPDRAAGDEFGYSVGVNTTGKVVVGAFKEDEDENGLNTFNDAGSAYVFERVSGVWVFNQKIVSPHRSAVDQFGNTVDFERNTDVIVVGARYEDHDEAGLNYIFNSGAVFVYEKSGGAWSYTAKLITSDRAYDDIFAHEVAIDGDYIVASAASEDEDALGANTLNWAGSAYVFEKSGGVWSQVEKLVAPQRADSDRFGWSVDVSGTYIAIGARYEDEDASEANTVSGAGSGYLFRRTSPGNWDFMTKYVPSDREANDACGESIALSGTTIVIGALAEDHDVAGANYQSAAGSIYVFDINEALPVELTNFDVRCEDGLPVLEWTTATETDNDYFTIERSFDALHFEPIATVAGNGNSSNAIQYKWTDDNPTNSITYYRLKQTDFSGTFEYFDIRAHKCEQSVGASIYPNPFDKHFTVQLSESVVFPITVEVLDCLGDKVLVRRLESNRTVMVPDTDLPPGTYMVRVFNETQQTVQQLVKLKY